MLVSDFELSVPFMVVSFENEDPRFFCSMVVSATVHDYTTLVHSRITLLCMLHF